MQETKKVRNCPLCGGKSECITNYEYGKARGAFCACTKCHLTQRIYASRQGAIKAWNKRYEENKKGR